MSWEFVSENEIDIYSFDLNDNLVDPIKYQVIIETE